MGVIAPMAKKLWGRCSKVAPTGILLCRRCTQPSGTVKLRCVIMKVKRCANFSLKMHQKCLAAKLYPDPLGKLTTLPRSPSWIKGVTVRTSEGGGKERRGRGDREKIGRMGGEGGKTQEGGQERGRRREREGKEMSPPRSFLKVGAYVQWNTGHRPLVYI